VSLEKFLQINSGILHVIVQGLGFVGSVIPCCGNAVNGDYAVIGVDQNTEMSRRIPSMPVSGQVGPLYKQT
jgi:hypothetical protein